MTSAVYIDPSQEDIPGILPLADRPALGYFRLTDLDAEALAQFDPSPYADPAYRIVEIHPLQWEALNFPIDRLSIVLEKSGFQNLTQIKSKMSAVECDITFHWDHRFHVSYYFKMLRYWIHCGARHFSFYDLSNFAKWQQLQQFLNQEGFHFYDRYHACLPGHESKYQKHLARFGDLLSAGGWSRVTENGQTRIRGPKETAWSVLSAKDAGVERMLFGMADRDGMALDDLSGMDIDKPVQSGLARIGNDRLIPTDQGLWDSVGLVAALTQDG